MKPLALIILAAAAFSLSSCSKNEKTAVEDFKKDLNAITVEPKARIGDVLGRLKAIDTKDLPPDLKDAWAGMLVGVEKMSASLATVSKDPKALLKSFQDPKAGEALQAKLQELGPSIAAFKKLQEVAKKYGIEGVEKIVPQ